MKILVIFVQALCTRSSSLSVNPNEAINTMNSPSQTKVIREYEGVIIRSAQSTSDEANADKRLSSKDIMDAPLSDEGIEQSKTLEKWVRGAKSDQPNRPYFWDDRAERAIDLGLDILGRSDRDAPQNALPMAKKTLLMTSNLPSALGTGIIALASRYRGTQTERETIYIMSSAQDLSSSQAADRRCLTQDGNTPKLDASFDKYVNHFNYNHDHNSCDQIEGTSGEKDDARLGRFCREMASMMKDLKKEMFVLAGHSTWIKAFLHKYLLNQYNFDETQLKNNDMKVGNASVISVKLRITEFTDRKGKSDFECQLMPGNTRLVYRPLPDKTK